MCNGSTPIIVSHDSAVCGIRAERRRYGELTWRPISLDEQREVIATATCSYEQVDISELNARGLLSSDRICHLAVGTSDKRLHSAAIYGHILPKGLPYGSIMRVAQHRIYACSPALTIAQMGKDADFPSILALIYELCGTCSLSDLSDATDERGVGYYESSPVLDIDTLMKALLALKGIPGISIARLAANQALDEARSPAEIIMSGMLATKLSYGGLGLRGIKLNHKLYFSREAQIVSGMPYAILDAFHPASKTDFEYNGSYHDRLTSRIHDEGRTKGIQEMGLTTVAVNTSDLANIEKLELIARRALHRAGSRFNPRSKGYAVKQIELLNGLLHAMGWPPC